MSEKSDKDADGNLVPSGKITVEVSEGIPSEVVGIIAEQFSGPIPSPDTMEKYERIQPGFADRIMRLSENEQSSRHKSNAFLLRNDRLRVLGSILVSLALTVAACFCAYIGQPWIAVVVLGAAGAIPSVIRLFLPRK